MDRNTALSALIDLRQILIEEGKPKIAEALGIAIEALNECPPVKPERPKGECRTCERCSDHCCETDEDLTRCPIEEHYSLPKDGYCHLYDPIWRGDKE